MLQSGNHWHIRFLFSRGTNRKKRSRFIGYIFGANWDLGFIEVEEFIKKKLGVKVDLVQKGALLPMIKEQILSETVQL